MKRETLTACALAALIPVGALASISVGDTLGTNVDEIRAMLEADGYDISEIETEDGEIEVEYMVDGQLFEMEIDAETGMIIEIELEDDDDDD